MKTTFNTRQFKKDMNNIVDYSMGFLEGVQSGKKAMLDLLGRETIQLLKEYVDSNARVNPEALQHVYEWYQSGMADGRLFDVEYTVSNLGLSVRSTFRQSTTIKDGSRTPFYDKARIMENGIPVVIKPKFVEVLSFDINGEQIFTRTPVKVKNPGGDVQGNYEQVFDSFFSRYFTQAFLRTSGIAQYLENPTVYKKNMSAGKRGGRAIGVSTGYRWIANAGVAI
jgi:hypothetical protein